MNDLKRKAVIALAQNQLSKEKKEMWERGTGCIYMSAINQFFYHNQDNPKRLPNDAIEVMKRGLREDNFELENMWKIYEDFLPKLGLQISEIIVQNGMIMNDLGLNSKLPLNKLVRFSKQEGSLVLPEAAGIMLVMINFETKGGHILSLEQVYFENDFPFVSTGGQRELDFFLGEGYQIFCAIGINPIIES